MVRYWGRRERAEPTTATEKLGHFLKKEIASLGEFCATGKVPFVFPGIKIANFGTLALPVNESQMKDLRPLCQDAPFGKGEATIVDKNVRNTLQLNADQVKITRDSDWQKVLNQIQAEVRIVLGLKNTEIAFHLYKLLIYPVGGKFDKHRDTEKEEGMFGTLVIQLPSEYVGGMLTVSHQSITKEIDFSEEEGDDAFRYVCFYADCEHEVLPVTEGYRACLVYNVCYNGPNALPAAPNMEHGASRVEEFIEDLIEEQNEDTECEHPFIAVVLDHPYTADSLQFDRLKTRDRVMASLLSQASKSVPFKFMLGIMEKGVTESGDDYGHHYGDEVEVTDPVSVNNLTLLDGTKLVSSLRPNEENQLYPSDHYEYADGEVTEESGPTGNEGCYRSRWYKDAVLVVIPEGSLVSLLKMEDLAILAKQHKTCPSFFLNADMDSATDLQLIYLIDAFVKFDKQEHASKSLTKMQSLGAFLDYSIGRKKKKQNYYRYGYRFKKDSDQDEAEKELVEVKFKKLCGAIDKWGVSWFVNELRRRMDEFDSPPPEEKPEALGNDLEVFDDKQDLMEVGKLNVVKKTYFSLRVIAVLLKVAVKYEVPHAANLAARALGHVRDMDEFCQNERALALFKDIVNKFGHPWLLELIKTNIKTWSDKKFTAGFHFLRLITKEENPSVEVAGMCLKAMKKDWKWLQKDDHFALVSDLIKKFGLDFFCPIVNEKLLIWEKMLKENYKAPQPPQPSHYSHYSYRNYSNRVKHKYFSDDYLLLADKVLSILVTFADQDVEKTKILATKCLSLMKNIDILISGQSIGNTLKIAIAKFSIDWWIDVCASKNWVTDNIVMSQIRLFREHKKPEEAKKYALAAKSVRETLLKDMNQLKLTVDEFGVDWIVSILAEKLGQWMGSNIKFVCNFMLELSSWGKEFQRLLQPHSMELFQHLIQKFHDPELMSNYIRLLFRVNFVQQADDFRKEICSLPQSCPRKHLMPIFDELLKHIPKASPFLLSFMQEIIDLHETKIYPKLTKPRDWCRAWDTTTLSKLGNFQDLARFWKSKETVWAFQGYQYEREAVQRVIRSSNMDAEIRWERPSYLPRHKRKNTCKVLVLTKTVKKPLTRLAMIKAERAVLEPPLRKILQEIKDAIESSNLHQSEKRPDAVPEPKAEIPKKLGGHGSQLAAAIKKRSEKALEEKPQGEAKASATSGWTCGECTFRNSNMDAVVCEICGATRKTNGTWTCVTCTYQNLDSLLKCEMCLSDIPAQQVNFESIELPSEILEPCESVGSKKSLDQNEGSRKKMKIG